LRFFLSILDFWQGMKKSQTGAVITLDLGLKAQKSNLAIFKEKLQSFQSTCLLTAVSFAD
jgi:hypothetical protein